ncbi:MAG: J domain-containing protein [Acidimicrobiales bacterium]
MRPLAADYYALLGVGPDASDDEIKRAYRRVARELHPDSTGGDPAAEARFKEVSQAYEVLRDRERRARYDRYGPDQMGAVPGDPFFGSGLGGLFDVFFGGTMNGGARRSGSMRGADTEVVVDLTLTEAVFGTERNITVEVAVACETCGGSGARQGTTAIRCPECDGAGELRRVRQSILGQVMSTAPCRRCQGVGEVVPSPCPDCRGEGRRVESRTYPVEVPAGVDHASTMRMSGRGAAGWRGGPAGDLYVHLSVREDERFVRSGLDLHAQLHVSMIQAALGATAAFSTLDGEKTLPIPAGTHTGHVIRVRGHGVPHVGGRGRGDLLVEVVVDTPTGLTKTQQEMLRRIAAERGEQIAPPDEGLMARLRSTLG